MKVKKKKKEDNDSYTTPSYMQSTYGVDMFSDSSPSTDSWSDKMIEFGWIVRDKLKE